MMLTPVSPLSRPARRRTLQQCLNAAGEFKSDGSVGSVERFAGIRNRMALWSRAGKIARREVPTPSLPEGVSPEAELAFRREVGRQSQHQIEVAMERCRRVAGLRNYRSQF